MPHFDVIVIGAGTGGLTAARLLSQAGRRVALVERERPGGDCLWFGCVPTKSLIEIASRMHAARDSRSLGVIADNVRLDWDAVREHVTKAQEIAGRVDSPEAIASWGTTLIQSSARFTSSHSVQINDETYTAGAFVIATGSTPSVPPVDGLAEAGYDTNVEAVEWETLPESLAIIGGGPVGVEFAQMCTRLGVRTMLFQSGEQLLKREEPEAATVIQRHLEREGVVVRTSTRVERVERDGNHRVLHAGGDPVRVERILVATGRKPNFSGLDLAAARIRTTDGLPDTNDQLRTNQPHIYVVGDASGAPKFTHVAEAQGRLVANVLRGKRFQSWSNSVVPRVTFTDPEVASVGLSAADARDRHGSGVETVRIGLDDVDRAVTMGATDGFLQIITAPGWNRYVPGSRTLMGDPIVGATLVAPNAGELLMPIVMAMRARLPQGIVVWNMQAYPTMSLGIRKALGARFDR